MQRRPENKKLIESTEILKNNLNYYLPSLVNLVNDKFFPWKKNNSLIK